MNNSESFSERVKLRIMARDGSNQRTVFHDESLTYIRLYAWSPDERWLAVEFQRQREPNRFEFGLVNSADGSLRVLKTTGPRDFGRVGRVEFSPDSLFVTYDLDVSGEGRKSDIFVINLNSGQETRVVAHPADDRLLGWAPFSNGILFSSDRRGSKDAWLIPFEEGKVSANPLLVKTDLGDAEPLGFTKSGAFYFSLSQFTSDIYTLSMDPKSGKAQGQPVRTVERFEGLNSAPDWSPDGRHLAFSTARSPSVLRVLDTQTQSDRVLAEGVFGPKWSPDGKSLLAFSGWGSNEEKIFRIDAATGSRTVLVEARPEWGILIRSYDWSPDGRYVYYQHDQHETATNVAPIVRRNIETGQEQEIHRVESGGFFAVSPDGRSIVFRANGLYLIPATGGQPKLLAQSAQGQDSYYIPVGDAFTWSADGRSVLVCKWLVNRNAADISDDMKSELVRVPVDGGEPETVLEMPRIRYPSVHPDGSRISFSAGRRRSELWVMENFLPEQKAAGK
ncbi:MAG: PD40 domain-containing protein [Verrucomicrobia bacterium]|nr:PD40 domain-containing protein [Verrucomicrobiota bacterium]